MVKKKRKVTPKQLANLAKGREILFQKQLRQRGINFNQKPQIIREIIKQPVINQVTTHQHNLRIQLSLFNKLLETKLFTLEINRKKENLNFYEIINRIYSKVDNQQLEINLNKENIRRIIDFVNSKTKKDSERFQKIEREIIKLKEESEELKKKLKELLGEDD